MSNVVNQNDMENPVLVNNQDKLLTDLSSCGATALTWKRPVSCSGVLMPLVCPGPEVSGLERQETKKISWLSTLIV